MVREGSPSTAFVVAISKDVDADPAFARVKLSVGMTMRGIDHESEFLALALPTGIVSLSSVPSHCRTLHVGSMSAACAIFLSPCARRPAMSPVARITPCTIRH
jgi:hypothetical protein